MNHSPLDMKLQTPPSDNPKEYAKFIGVLVGVTVGAIVLWELDIVPFMEALMGVFLAVFAGFKLMNLKEFAYGFQSYDIVAKKSLTYSYSYPFIQLAIGSAYLVGLASLPLHLIALAVSLVASVGVLKSLLRKTQVHCVCLGSVVKLPLSRISFVEDFGMAVMALAMILL